MPDARPGFTETNADQGTPGIGSPLSTTGGIGLVTNALPGFASPTSTDPGFDSPLATTGGIGLAADGLPGFASPTSTDPGIGSPLAAAGGIGLALDALPGFASSTSTDPGFVVSFSSTYLARTGETYVPHFDDINAPTFAPVTTEEDVIAGSTMTQLDPPAGTSLTMYIGLFEDVAESVVSLPVPGGTVAQINVRASAAPGAGKNFTYTLMKNGVAQSMSVAVSDSAQSGATTANAVSYSSGDRVSLRLVADAGASSAHHRFTLRYTVTA